MCKLKGSMNDKVKIDVGDKQIHTAADNPKRFNLEMLGRNNSKLRLHRNKVIDIPTGAINCNTKPINKREKRRSFIIFRSL